MPPIRTPGTPSARQIKANIEEFLLSLPLGPDADSAVVEQRVAEKLFETEAANNLLVGKVQQW